MFFFITPSFASHVLGGEITYKHIKENQYKITLKVYRDCNGCKINGFGGGKSKEDCSEIEYLYVKGMDPSGSKETKFRLTRELIKDITPLCSKEQSACSDRSTSPFGIEVQQFSATVDLDNSKIIGYCRYYVYVSFAERNADITTGQASQNFFLDAMINVCHNGFNNGPEFVSEPQFILNGSKIQYPTFQGTNTDKDSLVYSLTPALTAFDKEASYGTGFSYLNPISSYCPGGPCSADPTQTPPQGFYLDAKSGNSVFMPVRDGERGVISVKIEKYRKLSGGITLIGYVKRDYQVYVKTGDGNFTPFVKGKSYFEVCEGETLDLSFDASDEKNSISQKQDSVQFSVYQLMNGAGFKQQIISDPPYRSARIIWTPSAGEARNDLYQFTLAATDNFCPLNATGYKSIAVKVLPKPDLQLKSRHLGCGNYEVKTTEPQNGGQISVVLTTFTGTDTIFRSNRFSDTIPGLSPGKYLLEAHHKNSAGCITSAFDTLELFQTESIGFSGDTVVCAGNNHDYLSTSTLSGASAVRWYFNEQWAGNGSHLNLNIPHNGVLKVISELRYGKWICKMVAQKSINVVTPALFNGPSEIKTCYHSGDFKLNDIKISPFNGSWSSPSLRFNGNTIQTFSNDPSINDTLWLTYRLNDVCRSEHTLPFILEALPEVALSYVTLCEMNTPVQLIHLVKKPYKVDEFKFTWRLSDSSKLKIFNGNPSVYPLDLGYGKHLYAAKVTGLNGCSATDSALIEITPGVNISFGRTPSLCQGSGLQDLVELFQITPQNGSWSFYDFQLFEGNRFIRTDTCGTFEATYIYDQYGCYDAKTVQVSIRCKPSIQTEPRFKVCESALPVALNAQPAGGVWNGPYVVNAMFSPPKTGQTRLYTLKYQISDAHCAFDQQQIAEVVPNPDVQLFPEKLDFCEGESVVFNGVLKQTDTLHLDYNGNFYTHPAGTIGNVSGISWFKTVSKNQDIQQSIQLRAVNRMGCSSSNRYPIRVYSRPQIKALRDTAFCENEIAGINPEVKYNGVETLKFKWEESGRLLQRNKRFISQDLTQGVHRLGFSVETDFCRTDDELQVEIKPKPLVQFYVKPADVLSVKAPEFRFINNSEPGLSWLWNFGSENPINTSTAKDPIFTYSDTGSYTVQLTGTHVNGCSDTYFKVLYVKPDILLFVPNAFSPDDKNEEKNNRFGIALDHYTWFNMEIFDRWGQKVYASNDPKEQWDGTSGGIKCTPDVYFYSIKVISQTHHEYHYRGTITLIR